MGSLTSLCMASELARKIVSIQSPGDAERRRRKSFDMEGAWRICDRTCVCQVPNGKEEDEGVVLSCLVNIPDQSTFLLVLDAKECKELGRGVVKGITLNSLHTGFFK